MRLLRGHNDKPFGWPTPGRPIGRPGAGHPQVVFGVFSYYQSVMTFLTMVCLTVGLAWNGVELMPLLKELLRLEDLAVLKADSRIRRTIYETKDTTM
jgi:hypothetical protein